jgi:uncharacterized protein YqfB (UPF0267 family)
MTCTGCTYNIENGTCKTPKDFLKLCLKNFGCCIEVRDESLAKFNADDFLEKIKNESQSEYLTNSLANAEKELEKLLKKSDNEWKKELELRIADTEKKLEESKTKHYKESEILDWFANKIKNWNCSEKYANIKKFALEQLDITEPTDYEWEEKLLNELRATTVKDYRNSNIESAIKEVNYYKERIEGEKKHREEIIEFIEGFLKEIEEI